MTALRIRILDLPDDRTTGTGKGQLTKPVLENRYINA